jgi:hypothetical protein
MTVLNPAILSASIFASFVGFLSDYISTKKMINVIGKEAESNTYFLSIQERKHGKIIWIATEISFIIFFGLFDFTLNILFLGMLYGFYRGLAAIRNAKITNDYRRINLDAYRKDNEKRSKYLACFVVCVVISPLMFVIFSILGQDLLLILPIEGLILGIGFAFFRMYRLTHTAR